jgi:D-alanyl-D-alanine carboxypeptidase (penicillin-binding protein 5/6)
VAPALAGSQQVSITADASGGRTEGSAIGLLTGAQYSVDELFEAMLMVSANDAATALADANGGVDVTVAQMNALATKLGAYDTIAETPSGLDGWQQLTSAYDMALVLAEVLKQPRLLSYEHLASVRFPARKGTNGQVGAYGFTNQNAGFLDTVPGAVLAKAGFTDAALRTYAGVANRDGRQLGVILLRDSASAAATQRHATELLDWGFHTSGISVPIGTLNATGQSSTTSPPVNQNSQSKQAETPLPYIKLSQQAPAPGGRFAPMILLAGGALWLLAAFALTRLSRRRRAQLQL